MPGRLRLQLLQWSAFLAGYLAVSLATYRPSKESPREDVPQ